jgi:hypothetical protein
MSIIPYFETERLAAGFRASIERALELEAISIIEADWLGQVQTEVPASMTVQRVINAQSWTGGVLIIGYSDTERLWTYVYSPLFGLHVHESRNAAFIAISSPMRHLRLPSPPLQFQTMESAVIDQWSQGITATQTDQLQALAARLDSLPSLYDALDHSIARAFATLLPDISEPHRHPLLLVDTPSGNVVATSTLRRAALALLSHEQGAADVSQCFLSAQRARLTVEQAAPWRQALEDSVQALPAVFGTLLAAHWANVPADDTLSHQEALTLALVDDFVRALLRARAAGLLEASEWRWLRGALSASAETAPQLCHLLYHSSESEQPMPYAGLLAICDASRPQGPVYTYMPATGIQRFHDKAALQRFYLEMASQPTRPRGLAHYDWQSLQASAATGVTLEPCGELPFAALSLSIVQRQARDLHKVLRAPGAQSSMALATIENALDIRELVDIRLLLLDEHERWAGTYTAPVSTLTLPTLYAPYMESRARQLDSLSSRLQDLRSCQPSVLRCVESLLAPSVATISEGSLRAADLRLRHDGQVSSLAEFFLMRLSGNDPDKAIENVSLLGSDNHTLEWPDARWLLERIEALKGEFSLSHKKRLARYDEGLIRVGKGLLDVSDEFSSIYEALLRADLAEARDDKLIDGALLDLLQQALDQTDADQRTQMGMHLHLPFDQSRPALANTFVLTHSADMAKANGVLAWTSINGLQAFSSLAHLRQAVNGSMASSVDLRKWTRLAAPSRLTARLGQAIDPVDTHYQPSLHLQALTGTLLKKVCATEAIRRTLQRSDDLNNAIHCHYNPTLFRRFMSSREEPLAVALRGSYEDLINKRFNLHLPKWLQEASTEDLTTYQVLLERCAQLAIPELFYLYDIPEMEDYARALLTAALMHDEAGYPTDPDQIQITLKHYIPGPTLPGQLPTSTAAATQTVTKSLTAFSLTHFSELSSAVMSVTVTVPDKRVPSVDYLRALVARLDVATPYRRLLAEKLQPAAADYAKRRRLFSLAMQANLMACTCQAQLEGTLSLTAALYMVNVLSGPDALAREAAHNVQIQFSQLHLRASPDLPADPARGLFIIGPAGADSGPLVLYTAYESDYFLQEFHNEADLLRSLHADKRLQTLLLDRLDVSVRSRYAHNGLLHPHILWSSSDILGYSPTPAPAQLHRAVIEGNAFHHLFTESLANLQYLAQTRTVSKEEANWKAFRYLVTLGFEQSSLFLPGKLAVLVNTWQSFDWIKAGVTALGERKWGEALAEFTTALATLASSRENKAEEISIEQPIHSNELPKPTEDLTPLPVTPTTTIGTPTQSSTERLLGNFEAQDIELQQLQFDAARQLYTVANDSRVYAALKGHVFELRRVNEHWYIVKDHQQGPRVRLRSDNVWEFYLALRGGNEESRQIVADRIDHDIPRILTVQTEGMVELYQTHYGHYQQIHTSRTLAVHLLSTTLTNLNVARPWSPLPNKIKGILKATFGEVPDHSTLVSLRAKCERLLNELLSPSLSPENSQRIVTGYNKPGSEYHLGFTYQGDPKQRIFLTELFFRIPDELSMNTMARESDLLAHFQASTLIHELSHLALRTEDIAYVDAVMPNPAVLEQETATNLAFYLRVKDKQEKTLTAATPLAELFTKHDYHGVRDLSHEDGVALATVLHLTGAKSLAEARTLFQDDAQIRAKVILSNADSLTLLITQLGHSASLGFDD